MNSRAGPVLPKLIGARVRRREDPRLVQGQAAYVDDLKLPGMLHAAFKRSDVAHAIIRAVDTGAAAAMSGVELVLTGAQLAEHIGPIPRVTAFRAPDQHPLAIDRVRYVGEPVAVVVAADRYVARDAIDAIRVEYEELPAVVDPHAATEAGAARLHEDFERNVALGGVGGGTGDEAALDAAFARADVVVRQSMLNQRLAPNATEPRGVVARFEHGRQYLTIWSSTQSPHLLRTMVAQVLGLGEHQVRAIAPEVGGGFGAKKVYGEDHVVAALARIVRAPVKWIEDRTEAFLTTSHGRDIHGDIQIAARRDGSILALRAKLVADIGAYQALLTAGIPTNAGRMISGVYSIPLISHELTEVFTNKTPTDAYRGAGRPEGIYFLERAIDMLARELQMDPAEIRRRNFIPSDRFPYETATGLVYDSGDYRPNLERALQIAGWEGLLAERDAARAEGRIVGVGSLVLRRDLRPRTLGPGRDRRLGAFGGNDRARREGERHNRHHVPRPGPRDHVRADAGRPFLDPDRGHRHPARRHRGRKAGRGDVREPLAGRRRDRAAQSRREGRRQDEALRGRADGRR